MGYKRTGLGSLFTKEEDTWGVLCLRSLVQGEPRGKESFPLGIWEESRGKRELGSPIFVSLARVLGLLFDK